MSPKSSPKFLVAPNAFKGCLSAAEAAGLMARGLRGARLDLMPLSDGGDGLIEVLLRHHGGRRVRIRVLGPLGRPKFGSYALLADGRTAVVEMAQASGLAGIPRRLLDPLRATSYGTGQLMADAVRRGCRLLLVGAGGSASSDGGAGMAQALGARFLDAAGRELPRGGEPLRRLAHIDASAMESLRPGLRVVGLADVTNPILGPRGSAAVFGPQKGACAREVRTLEEALLHLCRVIKRDLGCDVSRAPGGGAGGGLGAGLRAFLKARLGCGADWVLESLGAVERLRGSTVVVTGEGKADDSTFFNKAPWVLAQRARRLGLPVLFLCGRVEPAAARRLERAGIRWASLSRPGESPERAMRQARRRLPAAAAALAKAALATLLLAPLVHAADAGALAEADRLYFHRDGPGNLGRSIEALQALLEKAPEDEQALWRLGRSLVRRGEERSGKKEKLADFTRAHELLDRAEKLDDKDASACYWNGMALGRLGETRGMLRSMFLVGPLKKKMRRALELDPNHGGAHHFLGEMARQIPAFAGGSKAEAVREFEEAVRLEPAEASHYTALAEAYLAVGRGDKARAALEQVLSIKEPADPADFPGALRDARRMLAGL